MLEEKRIEHDSVYSEIPTILWLRIDVDAPRRLIHTYCELSFQQIVRDGELRESEFKISRCIQYLFYCITYPLYLLIYVSFDFV